jgi:hypothetical protein
VAGSGWGGGGGGGTGQGLAGPTSSSMSSTGPVRTGMTGLPRQGLVRLYQPARHRLW